MKYLVGAGVASVALIAGSVAYVMRLLRSIGP